MSPATLQRLTTCLPAIKAEWSTLLRGEPTITPLGRPDTLVFLMDATLTQLLAGLKAKSDQQWLQSCAPVAGPVHSYCACGLNPLLKYFTTGELAVHAAAGPVAGGDLEEVLLLFRALAQQEIESLCAVCQHRNTPDCTFRPAVKPPSRSP